MGPDGDIWVAQSGGDVQRVKTDGTADGPAIPSGGSNLSSIAKGADGKFMWVTDGQGRGRVRSPWAPTRTCGSRKKASP